MGIHVIRHQHRVYILCIYIYKYYYRERLMEEYVGNCRNPATGYTLVGYFHTSFFVAMDGNIY